MSELLNFSRRTSAGGIVGVAAAVTAGAGVKTGAAGEAVASEVVAEGRANAGAGGRFGGVCFATHHSHPARPMTQRTMTIHAVRSINLVAAISHTH